MKTVIFDLDGTLADTSADLIGAANATFVGLGLGALLDPEGDKLTAFHGARAMLRLGFSRVEGRGEQDVEDAYPGLLAYYAEHIDRQTVLYPGAEAAVQDLLKAGYRVGICTNKPFYMAEDLMRRLGVRDMFHALVGAGTLPVVKPDPGMYRFSVEQARGRVDQSLIVGDTITDANTARAAGVPCILVGFGPEGDGVSRHGADVILPHYQELGGMVAELIGHP